MEIEEKMVQKDGEKGVLEELQRRNGSLPCFIVGQGVLGTQPSRWMM